MERKVEPGCGVSEHVLCQNSPLEEDMKRVSKEENIFRWLDLPPELQAHIILLIFDYKIKSEDERIKLVTMKEISKSNKLLIGSRVIPNLQYVDMFVFRQFTEEQIVEFVGIRKLKIGQFDFNCNKILLSMKQLVDLDLSWAVNDGLIHTERLLQLTRLVCSGDLTKDDNLKGLFNLRRLVLYQTSEISDQCLLGLTNLSRLDLMDIREMKITNNGLRQLSGLKKLVIHHGEIHTDNDFLNGLTQLKSLRLRKSNTNDIKSLVGLESLQYEGTSEAYKVFTDETYLRLTNLTKLHLWPGYLRPAMRGLTKLKELKLGPTLSWESEDIGQEESSQILSELTNLKKLAIGNTNNVINQAIIGLTGLTFLSLENNPLITNQGISTLTNLTFLNLTCNFQITHSVLPRLKSLQRIQETYDRIYYIENGYVRFF